MSETPINSRAGASRTVAVLGATGQQGGAVAAALLADGWTVRAVVRDPASEKARALADAGVEAVRARLDDPAALRAAFSGAHGVFSVQPSSGQPGTGLTDEDEVVYGTTVADAARDSGVTHLVYSSMIAAGPTPTGVAHFDVKSRIEAHLAGLDLTSTVVRPATFMELLLAPGGGLDRGTLSFLMRPDQEMQLIAVRDIGRVVAAAFAAPGRYAGRTLEIAGDSLTGTAVAGHLTRALGRPVAYDRISQAALEQDDVLARTVALVDDGRLAGQADLAALRAEFPFLLRFDRWLTGPGAGLLAAVG